MVGGSLGLSVSSPCAARCRAPSHPAVSLGLSVYSPQSLMSSFSPLRNGLVSGAGGTNFSSGAFALICFILSAQ